MSAPGTLKKGWRKGGVKPALGHLNKSHPDLRKCVIYLDLADRGTTNPYDGSDANNGDFFRPQIVRGSWNFKTAPDGSYDSATKLFNYNNEEPAFRMRNITSGQTESMGLVAMWAGATGLGLPPGMEELLFYKFTIMVWAQFDWTHDQHMFNVTDTGTTNTAFSGWMDPSTLYWAVRESSWSAEEAHDYNHAAAMPWWSDYAACISHNEDGGVHYFQYATKPDPLVYTNTWTWTESKGSNFFHDPTTGPTLCYGCENVGGGGPIDRLNQIRIYERSMSLPEIQKIIRRPWAPREPMGKPYN
jgi:hypothetical protein